MSELGHKAARLLLSPERDVGSGSRLALLLLACVVGAGLGLPAQLDPLRLGNQPARVQVAASSAPLGNAGASRGQAAVKAPADDTAQVEAAEARTAAGDALRARGRLLAAEAEYLRALVDRPNHPGALEGLARLMLARRDAAAATDWALRLASVAPDAAHVQLLLGEAHVLAGRTPSAVEAFTRAEALGAPEARAQLDALALRDAAATPK